MVTGGIYKVKGIFLTTGDSSTFLYADDETKKVRLNIEQREDSCYLLRLRAEG